ncbi:MAG: hypothetical protein Kow0029_23450 [Candidatus Rifleibacteriota bacterium]
MKRKPLGMTLVEITVVTILASIVMGSAVGIWSYSRRNMARTTARQILQQDAMRVLTHLQADLKAAKAETFKVQNDPLSLEFSRYVIDPSDSSKLSGELTQKVKYTFTKPILRRSLDGKVGRSLSNNVENINISRKELTAEEKEKYQYLESRVDINLELAKKPSGSNTEEKFIKHTSVVIRDEFYALANKERENVFDEADKVAEEMVKDSDSSFFSDELDAESLKRLTNEQLDDLEKTQKTNLDDAKKGLEEINERIGNVESGDAWYKHWFSDHVSEDVENLKKELKALECPDENIPEKGSGNRASEKTDEIIKKIDAKIKTMEEGFMKKAFGGALADPESADDAEKIRADLQKRAYEMKVMDRQVDKALAKMSDKEREEAEANGSIPTKMIDHYLKTEDQIRKEIAESKVAEEGSDEFNSLVAQEMAKINALKREYDNCDVSFLDNPKEVDKDTITAYDGAKQLRSLAESKKEAFKLKELAIDNLAEIEEARKLKKEELEDKQ